MLHSPDALRSLVEGYLDELAFTPELSGLEEALRYPLESGGKLFRPVIALAVGESAGAAVEHVLPAAVAVELVHTFSLVHDDLPALDDDDERRGRPSAHIAFGEATALLAGDALLAEAFRLALSYPTPMVGRELAQATLGMIGGQYLDITGDVSRSGRAAPAEDRRALLRLGRRRALGRGRAGELTAGLAGVRRRARAALSDRRRPARRGRLRGRTRRGGRTPPCRRGGRARAGATRRDPNGHECPRGDRHLARRTHGVVRPPAGVLAAFGSSAEPERLPGGMETSWRCGDLVLKPLDLSIEEVRWQGSLFERLASDGFRVPRLRGVGERLVCLGVPRRRAPSTRLA